MQLALGLLYHPLLLVCLKSHQPWLNGVPSWHYPHPMLGSSIDSCQSVPPKQFTLRTWHVAPTCWCWLWWHARPTCCCQVRASQLLRCCVAARSMRLEPWHRPPLSLRAVPCRWAWPRRVANLQGFRWSPLVSWRAPRPLASWLSSSMAPTPGPAAVCKSVRSISDFSTACQRQAAHWSLVVDSFNCWKWADLYLLLNQMLLRAVKKAVLQLWPCWMTPFERLREKMAIIPYTLQSRRRNWITTGRWSLLWCWNKRLGRHKTPYFPNIEAVQSFCTQVFFCGAYK